MELPLTTMRLLRTSVGESTEFVKSPTRLALSSSTCARKLCASSVERTIAPAVRIAAEAATNIQSCVSDRRRPADL
jgi:hypothetical protein